MNIMFFVYFVMNIMAEYICTTINSIFFWYSMKSFDIFNYLNMIEFWVTYTTTIQHIINFILFYTMCGPGAIENCCRCHRSPPLTARTTSLPYQSVLRRNRLDLLFHLVVSRNNQREVPFLLFDTTSCTTDHISVSYPNSKAKILLFYYIFYWKKVGGRIHGLFLSKADWTDRYGGCLL